MKKCKNCGAPLEGFLYKTIGKLMGIKPSEKDPELCNKCEAMPAEKQSSEVPAEPVAEPEVSAESAIEPEAEPEVPKTEESPAPEQSEGEEKKENINI
ncbi:MAG TPA: hypothetical protein ENN28_00710 [Candidatus Uhrbacteria bacterium]|nr:hypothetical protein [Candidatus Uhrbacteria bacterium]